MASTIKPFINIPNNQRSDPEVRFRDYQESLVGYLSLPKGPPDEIHLVDNSGYNLDGIHKIAESQRQSGRVVKVRSISPSMENCNSKPYGELDIQDQAYRVLHCKEDPDAVVWKVTGRLIVPNIQKMILSQPCDASLYCDLRDVPLIGNLFGGNPWFDMRLWSYTVRFYGQNLLDVRDRIPSIDEGALFSHVRLLMRETGGIAPRFKIQPEFVGYSGATNLGYDRASVRWKGRLRKITRKIAPFVWL